MSNSERGEERGNAESNILSGTFGLEYVWGKMISLVTNNQPRCICERFAWTSTGTCTVNTMHLHIQYLLD